jgi:hypothetical protein
MLVPEFLALSRDAEIPTPAASAVEGPVMLSEVGLASCCFVMPGHQKAVLGDRMTAKHYRGCSGGSHGS